MTKKRKTKINKEDEIKEYLKGLSQHIYNLRKIIDAHLTEPIEEDKDLNFFYLNEKDNLDNLLKSPVGNTIVSLKKIKLSTDLMFNRGKTKSAQKQLDDAEDFLRAALGKVQSVRHKYYNSSIPVQGLEDGLLKDYLVNFLDKKRRDRDPQDRNLVRRKNKVSLIGFPRTEWAKVSLKFIDDTNALLSDSRETKPIVPESIGCIDGRNQKTDNAWVFLLSVARGEGSTKPLRKIDRIAQVKQKQKITDILRKIFKNDTDPFEAEKGGIYKAKFQIGYIINEEQTYSLNDKFSDSASEYKRMTILSESERDENS